MQSFVIHVIQKITMQKTVIFNILFLVSLQVFSQTEGTVVDEKGNPLGEVVVFVYDYNIISKTNSSGLFIVNEELPKSTLIHFQKTDIPLSWSSIIINLRFH